MGKEGEETKLITIMFGRFKILQTSVCSILNLPNIIREAKQVHYKKLGEKLSDPQTGSKHFWNAFIRITNKRKHTKIPPIVDNNTYVTSSIYLTTTLQTNVKYSKIVARYRK